MKIKDILKEEESLEYGEDMFRFSETGTAIEKKIIRRIADAFKNNSNLQNTFKKKDYTKLDVIVKIAGPNVIITTNPENGLSQKVGTFPLTMVLAKSSKSLGEIIFEAYKSSI